MQYKFQKRTKRLSATSRDSGVGVEDCPGCLSMYCHACMEAQNQALRDVEELMERLEVAESLFPSSRAFGELFPLYNSEEFVGRVKVREIAMLSKFIHLSVYRVFLKTIIQKM